MGERTGETGSILGVVIACCVVSLVSVFLFAHVSPLVGTCPDGLPHAAPVGRACDHGDCTDISVLIGTEPRITARDTCRRLVYFGRGHTAVIQE